ncbi:SMP-30/gluconolactonase/LRE family protein [Novosphingobium album (ex Liu et al. 2023)]|uniref:SMP-30/gluconolactonase/LRE family protein n=1 Tax=Novosphingobium album (ex Liu et al. 2023) TaxID=3031130 RepID=A0ABT5WS76_9SPHN|nr:SMP-30/gluconolactonase/LRE family protein [Novosphingobium album (ex Liu et al. 2023)]MDE8652911.1 SMP-30/gluconolactonase/LRE family protein [Novosphingobium album (ex Liu et al. 2023)]
MTELLPGEFEAIATGIYLEGLAVDHEREAIWYSDVIGGGIHGVKPDGTRLGVLNEGRMWTGGVLMNADGAVLSSGQGGIMWNHPETGKSGWLIAELEGRPVNGINEMWPDGTGGIFFGTNDIEHVIAARESRPTAVYRLTRDRQAIRLAEGLRFSNGIAHDPARALLHCSDTFGKAYTWDVAPDLTLANRRVLLDRDDCDGMTIDAAGNVWIAGVFSPGIVRRVTPGGEELAPVHTPPGTTTQVRFGGSDGRDIYLNIVPQDAGECLKHGKPLSGTSTLYRGRSEVPGVKIAPANFTLG